MKMCKINLEKNEVQNVINELSNLCNAQKSTIIMLIISISLLAIGGSYLAIKVAENEIFRNSFSNECQIMLQEADPNFHEVCND